jgi:hypothetical protein
VSGSAPIHRAVPPPLRGAQPTTKTPGRMVEELAAAFNGYRKENAQWHYEQAERLTALERSNKVAGRRGIIIGIAAPLAGVLATALTVWGQLTETRETIRAQAPAAVASAATDEMVERVSERAAKSALEAFERQREQQVRRLIADERRKAPMPRPVDMVSTAVRRELATRRRQPPEATGGAPEEPAAYNPGI